MRRTVFILSAGLFLVFASAALAWVVLPEATARVLLTLNNASAGMSQKTLKTEIGDIHYLEGGQGETIVMIHGIYARKEHWVDMARHLVDDYRVVALDLPGFGDNIPLADDQYLLRQQQNNLQIVLDALGIDHAHIAANSMGAYVAALFAQADPERVSSFAFIGSPLGVPTSIKSDMDLALERGTKPLLAATETDFHARMVWLSPNPPFVPGPILKTWMKSEVAMAEKNARIWDTVHTRSTAPSVLDLAPDLITTTLVVWCRPDRIFHVSGADELTKRLANAELEILGGCGHVPMLDQPKEVARIYLDFLKGIATN